MADTSLTPDSSVSSTEPLRYPLVETSTGWRYGPWLIDLHHFFPWSWGHQDFDGADDANDHRHGTGSSRDECIDEIHRWEDERDDLS
jgi:hypothetical protein